MGSIIYVNVARGLGKIRQLYFEQDGRAGKIWLAIHTAGVLGDALFRLKMWYMGGKRCAFCFFGTTGVDKKTILPHFANWCRRYKKRRCKTIDFESEYLFNRDRGAWYAQHAQHQLLDSDQREQHDEWRLAWERLCKDVEQETEDIFIGLHGCFVRGHYGVRIITESAETNHF